jgi:hypothetical protein
VGQHPFSSRHIGSPIKPCFRRWGNRPAPQFLTSFFYAKRGPLSEPRGQPRTASSQPSLPPAIFLGALLFVGAATAEEPSALASDREFLQAAEKGNTAMLAKVLDADFPGTDASGRTLARAEVLNSLPATGPRHGSRCESGAASSPTGRSSYGEPRQNSRSRHLGQTRLRVAPAAYREVALGREGPAASDSARECENPCKTVPYKPKNEAAQSILSSWETRDGRRLSQLCRHITSEFTMLAPPTITPRSISRKRPAGGPSLPASFPFRCLISMALS